MADYIEPPLKILACLERLIEGYALLHGTEPEKTYTSKYQTPFQRAVSGACKNDSVVISYEQMRLYLLSSSISEQ